MIHVMIDLNISNTYGATGEQLKKQVDDEARF